MFSIFWKTFYQNKVFTDHLKGEAEKYKNDKLKGEL